MKDRNGAEVKIGAKAILTDAAGDGFAGRQGIVQRVEPCRWGPGDVAIVEGFRDGRRTFSAACEPNELVIVEANP